MKKTLALAVALLAGSAAAQGGGTPYMVQETGERFASLQQAVDAIGGGSGTISIAPGTYRDCAIQEAGSVAYVAAEPGTVAFDGGICEGKAAIVMRGREARIEGVIFQNMRVSDGNGAGIRMESGRLLVRESLFRDSESGILSANDPGGEIRVEQSTFSGLGRCDRGLSCAHSIYIGDFGLLSVSRVRFERGTGGHYVKTRSPRVEVVDSSFDDTGGRTTNYMIDLSHGATGRIAGNTFVQGPNKENYSALIMVAAEDVANSSDGLEIADNDASVAPGFTRRTSFVADASGHGIRIENNRLGPQIARFERR
jgi:hypothetical protein